MTTLGTPFPDPSPALHPLRRHGGFAALLAAPLLLALAGVVSWQSVVASAFSETMAWMLGAFVLAGLLQGSGLPQKVTLRVAAGAGNVGALFLRLNLAIGATAFFIPSTSARAALLLPVFLALVPALPGPRAVRALALLFPTAILLSAGASLTGAGAHLVAVEFIARETGVRIGWWQWAALGLPLALLTSTGATLLILRLFLSPTERRKRLGSLSAGPALRRPRPADALRRVDVRLLLLLAATTALGQALLDSGAADALTRLLLGTLPLAALPSWALVLIATAIAVALHLVLPSRTARLVLLLPTVSLPLAAAGADITLLTLVCAHGSGFCQTLMLSAKPVAVFARAGDAAPPFDATDLLRLALPLGPAVVACTALFALGVWPWMGGE